MSQRQPNRPSPLLRAVKKYSVSAFVICSFSAYAVHERMLGADAAVGQSPTAIAVSRQVADLPALTAQPRPAAAAAAPATSTPMQIAAPKNTAGPMLPPAPTAAPPTAAPPVASGKLKDGEYTGQVADAYYGDVQVKAVIRGGQIADVSFLTYPNHRRTSVRINTYAMPYLTSEALQVQGADVNIISGATLTSQAFAQSLQSALDAAKS